MHLPNLLNPVLLLGAGLAISVPVAAQYAFSCRQPNGSHIQSDRPCSSSQGLTCYPPISTPAPSTTYIPKASSPPDYL